MNIPDEALEAAAQFRCQPHHWVSNNVPGLLIRWIIQCSICDAYNIEEMNATTRHIAAQTLREASDAYPLETAYGGAEHAVTWLKQRADNIQAVPEGAAFVLPEGEL